MIRHRGDFAMKEWRDSRWLQRSRWYAVPFGTPGLPLLSLYNHYFAFPEGLPALPARDGEVGETLPYYGANNGARPRFWRTPRRFCGEDRAWQEGADTRFDAPLTWLALGYSTCCLGVESETFGEGGAACGSDLPPLVRVIRRAVSGLVLAVLPAPVSYAYSTFPDYQTDYVRFVTVGGFTGWTDWPGDPYQWLAGPLSATSWVDTRDPVWQLVISYGGPGNPLTLDFSSAGGVMSYESDPVPTVPVGDQIFHLVFNTGPGTAPDPLIVHFP